MQKLSSWILGLLILLGLLWGGWLAVGYLNDTSGTADLPPVELIESAQRRTLEEAIITRGTTGFPVVAEVQVGAPGRVTSVGVRSGDVIDAGTVLARIDGRPVVSVARDEPFWRDLARGTRGDDVLALQTILADAGYLSFEPDGRFGPGTATALRNWQRDNGQAEPDGILSLNDVVVGEWPARVGQVRVRAGDFVNAGDPLVELTADAPAVSVELVPSDRLQVTEGLEVRVEVAATGQTATGVLSDVALDPVDREGSLFYPATVTMDDDEFDDALELPEGTQVRLVIVTARADDVLTVPVAAVVSDAEGRPVVRVVSATGERESTPVELGMSQGAWVEITAGLADSARVVVAETSSNEE